jgi:hypothetical protein
MESCRSHELVGTLGLRDIGCSYHGIVRSTVLTISFLANRGGPPQETYRPRTGFWHHHFAPLPIGRSCADWAICSERHLPVFTCLLGAQSILALPTLKGPTYAVMRTEYET